jgi:excisionase family DNA binding protein
LRWPTTTGAKRIPLLLNKKQAAEELGVSRDVLRRLLDRGEIGVLLIEEEERIPAAELVRFVERRTEHRACPKRPAQAPGPQPDPWREMVRLQADWLELHATWLRYWAEWLRR